MRYTFICELPPPFGGVTIKNKLILDSMLSSENVDIIDLYDCKRSRMNIPGVFYKMIRAFVRGDCIIYGLGSYQRLEYVIRLQKFFGGSSSLLKTVNFVMGGNLPQRVKDNPGLCNMLSNLKINYVETVGMIQALSEEGILNAKFFPNARNEKNSIYPRKREQDILSCVFFSQISMPKGVALIFQMLKQLPEACREKVHIDFYGHIVAEFQNTFDTLINSFPNVRYCGVFDAVKSNVYQKLNEYDVLLLPTLRIAEGVPGVLVEAKMAGVCPIVTDCCYNEEIVRHEAEGIVLKEDYVDSLTREIVCLLEDREKLNMLKEGSYHSRMRYAMETYVELIRGELGMLE